jgi:hypothetical protein
MQFYMKRIFLSVIVIIASIISIMYIMKKSKQKSRGLRNNNPFNLRLGDSNWQGEITGEDPDFEVFSDIRYGIRAGLINLYNVYFSKNLTLRQIIAKYAPASDNNNELAYVDSIVKLTGVIPEQIPGKDKWLSIAAAIMYHENGSEVKTVAELVEIVNDFKLTYYA